MDSSNPKFNMFCLLQIKTKVHKNWESPFFGQNNLKKLQSPLKLILSSKSVTCLVYDYVRIVKKCLKLFRGFFRESVSDGFV